MNTPLWIWVSFILSILMMLALDLGLFHRKKQMIQWKEGLIWSGIWITLSLLFNSLLYFWQGHDAALSFTTCYLIEKSLSIDNIFVFLMIFSHFKVPPAYQHQILFWGILGALIMRGIFIHIGITLIDKFNWMPYLLGGFLIFTGIRMLFQKKKIINAKKNIFLKIFSYFVPIHLGFKNGHFFIQKNGHWKATSLFIALIFLETTDLIFAMDSIPAVIAVTHDSFIVYTSNVFAVLGLRSLYFVLSAFIEKIFYLKFALASILVFVGFKMTLTHILKISPGISLTIIFSILTISALASLKKYRYSILPIQ